MLSILRRRRRLLLLDDDPSMQRLIAHLARGAGYRIDVVSEARQALQKIASRSYDVLLLDIMTPTEGGMTVIRHLRNERPELLRRVILVTGSPDSVLRSIAADVFAVVRKPFESAELLDRIQNVSG